MTAAAPAQPSTIDAAALQRMLAEVFAPWVQELQLQVLELNPARCCCACRWRRSTCTAVAWSAARR